MCGPNAKRKLTCLAIVSALTSMGAYAADAGLAPWLTQMGETSAILSAANWGKGQLLGVVDTGIVASHPIFASGQVSAALSACAATSFRCSNGVTDDNGHGTAVAAIAAANRTSAYTYRYAGYTVAANSYLGVAPNANIVAEKVLNTNGSGTSADVANGINRAVAAGATVINLSLTYLPTADIVAAVNNAAAKGAFIVWAGGNDGKALLANASSTGLSAAAIKRLLFVGALDTSAAKAASFSSTPGSGALVSTTGGKTSYASRWISAPGVNILAPGIAYGSSAMALWSGTSMSAPLVSGSLLLLESAWPILRTNGTAADLLLGTATDLGAKGVDAIYGMGLVNLSTAFAPVGALSVTQANGKTVAVGSITGSMIAGGAFGSLSAVRTKLASTTALDTYARNFTVDLSGLIQVKPTSARVNALPSKVNSGVVAMKYSDGSELRSWQQPAASAADGFGLTANSELAQLPRTGYLAYTDRSGSTLAMGYGVPSQISYARALYGKDDLSLMASELNASTLADHAQGGYHFAYGTTLGHNARVALSFGQTPASVVLPHPALAATQSVADASTAQLGLSYKFDERWTGGLTLGRLGEQSGLLGSTYQPGSALSLGANTTTSLGLSLAYALSDTSHLLFETGMAHTCDAASNGLFADVSNLASRSYGVTFHAQRLFNPTDGLSISIKQPLRVVSGSVGVVSTRIDDDGVAHYSTDRASLVPTGREIDFTIAYDTRVNKTQSLSLQFTAVRDVLNVSGERDASIGAIWSTQF